MRKILVLFLFVALNAVAQKRIVILQTNDCHSQILPFNKNLADKTKADLGGFTRRVAYVKQQREKNPDLLLFDSGDFSQGSSYYNLFKGDVEIGLMNIMHYDAATIGNHEFDFGLDNMARIFRMAEFPIVCANYDFKGTVLEDIVKPYVVLKRNGLKIGVFGLSPKLEGLVVKENYGSIKYLDPVSSARDVVKILREKEKCDLVVCLSHLGWKTGDEEPSDERLIPLTDGIDVVLGGHTHSYVTPMDMVYNSKGNNVLISQNGKSGMYISRFDIKLK
ncbi:MAG: metallophosphatase [Prevotellaceae bacterium]|nr:metallophosphatase [Prevotellaceae bacterium]